MRKANNKNSVLLIDILSALILTKFIINKRVNIRVSTCFVPPVYLRNRTLFTSQDVPSLNPSPVCSRSIVNAVLPSLFGNEAVLDDEGRLFLNFTVLCAVHPDIYLSLNLLQARYRFIIFKFYVFLKKNK